jgi:OmpA-OmpF porin, OOP family
LILSPGEQMMKKMLIFSIGLFVVISLASIAYAQGGIDSKTVEKLLDSARAIEAQVFSPKAFLKAKEQFDLAIRPDRNPSSIPEYLTRAREFTENAIKNTEVCKLSLNEYLPPRDKARAAKAYQFVPILYEKAESQFIAATSKVESGDVKGALKEAAKSSPLYYTAELEAILVDVLGKADTLIANAVLDEAPKYALTILDKARTARAKANGILTADRYNRKDAQVEATRAEYEARHASSIAQSVRSLNRNDQAWEKLMLLYEIQMNRVGEALKLDYLPFDNGPLAAADTLIAGIRKSQTTSTTETSQLQDSMKILQRVVDEQQRTLNKLTSQLSSTVKVLNGDSTIQDPMVLALAIDNSVVSMIADRGKLSEQMATEQGKLSQLSEEHKEVSAELQAKQDREDRLAKAKAMIDPTQGEIFVNSSNDIVLRLSGLSFAAGKSEITEQHRPLLEKVKEIIGLFTEPKLVVEGHTDDKGDPSGNTQLSEKRAFAVMQYLRQTMSIPSDRIRAIGYGSEKPIASQSTTEGRAKNRRIDILILQ